MLIIRFLKRRCSEVKENWCSGIRESQKGLDFRWTPSVWQMTFPWWLQAGDAAQGSQPISLSASDVGSRGSPLLSWNLRMYKLLPGETTHCFLQRGSADGRGLPDLEERAWDTRRFVVPHITDCSMSVADRSCLRVPRKPLLSASRLSAGLQDLVHIWAQPGSAGELVIQRATQLLEDRSQWTDRYPSYWSFNSGIVINKRDSSEVYSTWFPRLTLAGLNPSFPQWSPAHSVIQSFKKIVANYTHTYGLPRWRNAKECLPMLETLVQSLGWEDPLEKEMAICPSILAWKIP